MCGPVLCDPKPKKRAMPGHIYSKKKERVGGVNHGGMAGRRRGRKVLGIGRQWTSERKGKEEEEEGEEVGLGASFLPLQSFSCIWYGVQYLVGGTAFCFFSLFLCGKWICRRFWLFLPFCSDSSFPPLSCYISIDQRRRTSLDLTLCLERLLSFLAILCSYRQAGGTRRRSSYALKVSLLLLLPKLQTNNLSSSSSSSSSSFQSGDGSDGGRKRERKKKTSSGGRRKEKRENEQFNQ